MRIQLIQMLLLALAMSAVFRTGTAETAPHKVLLLVANKGNHTLSLIEPASGHQVAVVDVGGVTGHEVIASPDGRFAYVPIYGDSGVGLPGTDGSKLAIVDLSSHKVVGNIDFGHGVRPHCPQIGPKDGLLYVTTEIDNAVTVIDPATQKILAKIPTGQPESHMLAITRDGRRGYTANVGPGTISVLDLQNRKTLEKIAAADHVQRVALSVDDRFVFTADQSKPQLVVIDAASNKPASPIPLPGVGYGAAATPDGRWLVVPLRSGNQVAIVDLSAKKVARTIGVPAAPQEALISPDGSTAYVSCDASHKVAAIRISDWSVDKLIDAGPGADGLAWAASR